MTLKTTVTRAGCGQDKTYIFFYISHFLPTDDPPDAMTMGPDQLQDNQPKHSSVPSLLDGSVDDQWKTQVQHLLTELVQVQTKLAKNQEEELKLLNILTTQVSFDFSFYLYSPNSQTTFSSVDFTVLHFI